MAAAAKEEKRMKIYHRESFTTIEATAEDIRSSRSLSDAMMSALNNLFNKVAPDEDPEEEEEPEEEDEEE